ncbi:MAG TPA: hypothetical protein EYN66_07885, partial [Myxococcales bacterium]|nr:hypothetical protein [Myxococcales bacterium]
MRVASKAHLDAAILGNVLTIVRGTEVINIPASELSDLLALVSELAGTAPKHFIPPVPIISSEPIITSEPIISSEPILNTT